MADESRWKANDEDDEEEEIDETASFQAEVH